MTSLSGRVYSYLLQNKSCFAYHIALGYTGNTCDVQTHGNLNGFSCGGKGKLKQSERHLDKTAQDALICKTIEAQRASVSEH